MSRSPILNCPLLLQEVQHTVLMSRELAKRCLWISRGGKAPDPPSSPGDQELRRRLEALQKTLKVSSYQPVANDPYTLIIRYNLLLCYPSVLDT